MAVAIESIALLPEPGTIRRQVRRRYRQSARADRGQRIVPRETEQDRLIRDWLAPTRIQAEQWTAEVGIRLLVVVAVARLLLGLF